MKPSRFAQLFMGLPSILAAASPWSDAYRQRWKTISEQGAVRIAQAALRSALLADAASPASTLDLINTASSCTKGSTSIA